VSHEKRCAAWPITFALMRRAFAPAAVAGALAVLYLPLSAAQASALSPLPRSDYGVRSVCGTPAPGHVACLALQLLPRTAAARARTHPLGMRTAQAIRAASAAQGAYGLGLQQLRNAYFPGEEPRAPASQTIALVDPYNDLGAEADLRVYDEVPPPTAALNRSTRTVKKGNCRFRAASRNGMPLNRCAKTRTLPKANEKWRA